MLQSQLFSRTRKEPPAEEVSRNAKFLMQAGFVDKLQAGVYTYLPLGFRVLRNIERIIREEMVRAGGREILMPALHPKEIWEKTGRWGTMDDLYKLSDGSGREYALGPTHEEVVVPLAQKFISSYRDLPLALFQIQTKFRMERRAKSGILRGREFLMKDLYSFHADAEDLKAFYEKMKTAYRSVFARVGLGDVTYLTFASGGSFSEYSHEFQTVTSSGEDTIHLCEVCKVAVNDEIRGEQESCPECGNRDLKRLTAIEVGNIFELRTKFSEPFGLKFKTEAGEERLVEMGCFGIGLGRVMGTIAEVLSDEKGLIWPATVAPFALHLLPLPGGEVETTARSLYDTLRTRGVDVLYDDRDARAGEKFADADLLGIPYRVVVSERTLAQGKMELKGRTQEVGKLVSEEELIAALTDKNI